MKKNIKLLAVLLGMTICATGCGSNNSSNDKNVESDTQAVENEITDYSKYITLGDYLGVEIASVSSTITDEDLENEINMMLEQHSENVEITDRDTVMEGDIANIDYKGMKDGVAFDGGTASGYDLEIGSGTFIDGFEDQLIGVKVGDTVDLNLTFPQNYGSEELAGQDVVFEVKVNSISTRVVPELTEEFVESNTEYDNIEDFKKSTMEDLQKRADANAISQKQSEVWNAVTDNTTVIEYPQELLDKYTEQVNLYYGDYAKQYEIEVEEFMKKYLGTTMDDYIKRAAQQEMIFKTIVAKEGLDVSDDELTAEAQNIAQSYGYDSAEALIEAYGEESVKENVLWDKMMTMLTDAAVEK